LEILLLVSAALVVLLISGFIYQTIATARDERRFPPPGRMLEAAGCRLHLIDSESGSTAVIFESGISASCLNWTEVRTEVAEFARACAYDRAGLGWSPRVSAPRVTTRLIEELHALLAEANVPAPHLLVGHSFGGLLVSAYAARYPTEVAGLILVDPLPADEWRNAPETHLRTLGTGVRLARRGAMLARIGLVRLALQLLAGGSRRVPKVIARLSSGQGESLISRLVGEVGKMPREVWPIIRAHWSQPKSFLAMADYLESLPASSSEAAALGDLPPIPITILSAGHSTPAQLAERDEVTRRSTMGRHIVAAKSGHWIQLDQPDLLIQIVREMVTAISNGRGSLRAL